jgi:hypothetical protein
MSPQSRAIVRLVVRRWLIGVFLLGTAVPLGLLAVFLSNDQGVEVTTDLIAGRGELFLIGGTAVLTAIVSCLDGRPDARLSTEAALLLVLVLVLPSFAVWAKGCAGSLSNPTEPSLSAFVANDLGRAAVIVGDCVAFALLFRHARYEVLKGAVA